MLRGRLAPKLDSSDVVQQGLLKAFAQLGQFQGHNADQWHHWVLTIVKNQAQKVLRYWYQEKRDVRREQRLANSSGCEPQLSADGSTPSKQVSRREQAARLLAAIQQLPPDYQQVLQLRNFENLPFAAVALRMNRSSQATRKLWARAVQQLRVELGDD
jgi:RNA polymerase sigma-70 factor (ECF subfamily)